MTETTNDKPVYALYNRVPSTVEAERVTEANMTEVANWCKGEIRKPAGGRAYIKIEANPTTSEKFTQAWVGDWILKQEGAQGTSFKKYSDRAFRRNYYEASLETEARTDVAETVGTPLFDQIYTAYMGHISGHAHELVTRITEINLEARKPGYMGKEPETSEFFTGETSEWNSPAAEAAAFKAMDGNPLLSSDIEELTRAAFPQAEPVHEQ